MNKVNDIVSAALNSGAAKAEVISGSSIVLSESFYDLCASNACGNFGRCWMCPPDVGDIEVLMARVREYDHALVYQIVSELEDSFDFEGMIEAKKKSYPISQKLRRVFTDRGVDTVLHLGAGGCGVCETCSKRTGEPCRHPDIAMPSLEAYGINVSKLASAASMKYINGQNTVTYFGAVLFCD